MKILLAVSLLLSGGTGTTPLLAHQEPRGIGNLVVPGDKVSVTYSIDSPGVKAPTGFLYVRNDRMRRFVRIPLRRLSAGVPASLLHGRKLTYYAILRDPKTLRTARMPRRSSWILEHAQTIRLGSHRFGRTRSPDATVAHWASEEVGWQGEGDNFGPETFLVAADGSVWLDDELNSRLLVAQLHGGPRAVPLPYGTTDGDGALGPGGTLYVTGGEGVGVKAHRVLYHLGSAGEILWKSRLYGLRDGPAFLLGTNSSLRYGPDGTLHCLVGMPGLPGGRFGWMPVASPAGQPLTMRAQRTGTHWPYQPVADGIRLVSETYTVGERGPREARFALFRHGSVFRAWRVTSGTDVNFDSFTPELRRGELVVALDMTGGTGSGFRWEYEVLRLGPHGLKARFSLSRVVYGDNLLADVRLGPDGRIYQLASSPAEGVTIYRYDLR